MCGATEFRKVLARTDRPADRWWVCDECAFEMIYNHAVAGVWRQVDAARVAPQRAKIAAESEGGWLQTA